MRCPEEKFGLLPVARETAASAHHDARLRPFLEQLEAGRISLQDIAYALRHYADKVDADPQELERAQARLTELERIHRKYGPDLLEHLQNVRREIDSIGLTETKKEQLSAQIGRLQDEYSHAAALLSKKRRTTSKSLESGVEGELKSLAMPHARFMIAW